MNPAATAGLAEVKQRLRSFAERVESSPLYAHLAAQAAEDDDVAGLLTAAADADAQPTLLLAAAHRLMQAEPIHPLSRYYPTLGGYDGVDGQTWPTFRSFLLERAGAARELIATRFTQTNEVQRAAVLFPAVAQAARDAGGPRGAIALLEVGCSAGLLLGMDRFAYRYQCDGGEQFTAGPAKAGVGLHCAVEGAGFPRPPKKLTVGAKIGLDRAPVDTGDEDELAWLEACVWADQPERARLLRTAAAQAKDRAELVAGDAVRDLAATALRLPVELPVVVFTSSMMAHMAEDARQPFVAAIAGMAAQRPVWWVCSEPYEYSVAHVHPGRDDLAFDRTWMNTLAVTRWRDGRPDARILAQADPHGKRMTWLG